MKVPIKDPPKGEEKNIIELSQFEIILLQVKLEEITVKLLLSSSFHWKKQFSTE